MRRGDAYVGQLVRIRDWDDMEKEFGCYEGNIQCMSCFIKSMKCLCGTEFIIEHVDEAGVLLPRLEGYIISTDMVEEVPYTIDVSDELNDFIGSIIVK